MRRWGVVFMFVAGCASPPGAAGEPPEGWHDPVDTDDGEDSGADTSPGDGDPAGGSHGGDDDDDDPGDSDGSDPDRGRTYHAAQQKSSHNSYERHEALVDQLAYHRIRSLELDIHPESPLAETTAGDWFVYHDPFDYDTSCLRLSDCLRDIRSFTNAVVDHEVITVWIDLKRDFAQGHGPADLDARLQAELGSDLYTPEELRASCPQAVAMRDCTWPTLPELRGRVVVMLTGGSVVEPDEPLSRYLAEGTQAFVAPDLPESLDAAPFNDVAVLNGSTGQINELRAAVHDGYIARVYTVNDESNWLAAADAKIQHIATDKVNWHRDPWAVTHDVDTGWPFTCTDHCGVIDDEPEAGTVVGIKVDSGDLWSDADDFAFAFVNAQSQDEAWTALVSGANSHVEKWVKGCVMARAGLDPDAPYFAVCRPADEERLRVQKRPERGGGSQATEDDIVNGGVHPTSAAWVRIDITDGGRCVTGYGAHRRDQWVEIDHQCFDEVLTHRGLAASSHDAGEAHMLFVAPRRDAASVQASALSLAEVGSAAAFAFGDPIP